MNVASAKTVFLPISQNLDLEICRQYFVLKYSEKATLIGILCFTDRENFVLCFGLVALLAHTLPH